MLENFIDIQTHISIHFSALLEKKSQKRTKYNKNSKKNTKNASFLLFCVCLFSSLIIKRLICYYFFYSAMQISCDRKLFICSNAQFNFSKIKLNPSFFLQKNSLYLNTEIADAAHHYLKIK